MTTDFKFKFEFNELRGKLPEKITLFQLRRGQLRKLLAQRNLRTNSEIEAVGTADGFIEFVKGGSVRIYSTNAGAKVFIEVKAGSMGVLRPLFFALLSLDIYCRRSGTLSFADSNGKQTQKWVDFLQDHPAGKQLFTAYTKRRFGLMPRKRAY